MIVDTHCHLDFKDFDKDRDAVIDRAKKIGVGRIINVGSSLEGTKRSIGLAEKYDIIYASAGIHPHDAKSVTDRVVSDIKILAKQDKVVAIGEVGLDYFRNLSPKEEQQDVFKKFIKLSLDLGLPLIIHTRQADEDILNILNDFKKEALRGVIHCFSGDSTFLKRCLDLGLYISFTCNLTFKNAENLREVAKNVPVEKLLLETDAPFLAPDALRGKTNEPANLVHLIDEWTNLTALSKEDIARITTHNANTLFNLDIEDKAKIAYQIRDSLYLNITNECTNVCEFCIRSQTSFVKGYNLRLEKEPTVEELLEAVGDPKRYKEVVFCGYGEPTTRMNIIKTVAKKLKERGAVIRIVTNGHGDLINSRKIAKELTGIVDKISISLNTDTELKYNVICKPKFGPRAYKHVIDFIKDCVDNNIETEVTCIDLPNVDVKKCEETASSLGASFRLRSYGTVG